MPNREIETLLPGETLNLTLGGYGSDAVIELVHVDGVLGTFSARTKGNSDGEKRDRSATGIFVASSDANALDGMGTVFGPFDIVYNASTSGATLRCRLSSGTGL